MSDEEFYQRPVLHVRDVPRSIEYYCAKLGFTESWAWGGESPIIAQVTRNGLDLILDAESVIPRAAIPTVLSMTLHQGERLVALHREFEAKGAIVRNAPFEVAWEPGVYQLEVEDPDGNVLVFWGEAEPG